MAAIALKHALTGAQWDNIKYENDFMVFFFILLLDTINLYYIKFTTKFVSPRRKPYEPYKV